MLDDARGGPGWGRSSNSGSDTSEPDSEDDIELDTSGIDMLNDSDGRGGGGDVLFGFGGNGDDDEDDEEEEDDDDSDDDDEDDDDSRGGRGDGRSGGRGW